MADTALAVAKEALWRVYVLTCQGRAIDLPSPPCAPPPSAPRPAATQRSRWRWSSSTPASVDARLDVVDADVNFAAAHAITDFALRTRDAALFTRLL